MMYRFIEAEKENYAVRVMCRVLQVSASGYYAFARRGKSARSKANATLSAQIVEIHQRSRQTYGSRRVMASLKREGQAVGRRRVMQCMREKGLILRAKKSGRCTTDSNHSLPVAENLIKQRFETSGPGQVWTSDITYIPTAKGFVYLCIIMELYSRRVIGHAVHASMPTELCLEAFEMACARGHRQPELIHHSDRGSQYASQHYQTALRARNIRCSMSRKGNCYDNAVTESFFATLEKELLVNARFQSSEQARSVLFEYIEVFYNRRRLHSSLAYETPFDFENRYFRNRKVA